MKKHLLSILVILLVLTACAPGAATPAAPITLNVITHDSFSATEDLVRQFEAQSQIKINFIKSGDTGAMVNRAILTKNSPQADVIYGIDNTFLSRALDADLFEPYASPQLKNIPEVFQLDPGNRALPVDFGDVCINYDKAFFRSKKLAIPQSLEDLLKPEYKGLLVMENPATSSPGLAFLLATIAHFGPEKYLEYWKGLRQNELVVVSNWETAYYTNFSGSSGKGSQPMVVSYGSSPAAEVIFAKNPPSEAPTASLVGTDMCFRQVEFVGIVKGTKNRAPAEKFIDFMLGKPFQEDMPLQMFVYPVNKDAVLPEEFVKFAQKPDKPAALDPQEITLNREKWIDGWKTTVLD